MSYSAQGLAKLLLIILFCYSLLLYTTAGKVFAIDKSLGIAVYLSIAEKDVPNGSVISFSDKAYILNRTAYNPLIVGVVADTPAVAIGSRDDQTYAVVSTGNTYVRVSGEGGSIKPGDLITGSSKAGVAMKATHSGYIIASALEDFTPTKKDDEGLIAASLNIHYYTSGARLQNNLLDIFSISSTAAYEQPTTVFKYVVAGLVVIASFVFGFYLFGRTANKGIDALGRNPLAGKMIQLGIFLNVSITIAIIASGIIVAFLVLRL